MPRKRQNERIILLVVGIQFMADSIEEILEILQCDPVLFQTQSLESIVVLKQLLQTLSIYNGVWQIILVLTVWFVLFDANNGRQSSTTSNVILLQRWRMRHTLGFSL